MQRYPMTPIGYKKLQETLKHLKEVERPANIREIEEARAHGDLSENAEYDAAKERQGFLEAKIRELESKLALAQVIDPATLSGDTVKFGATVTLLDLDSDQEVIYTIVGEDESDIQRGRISYTSPVARALIGKEEGDDVEVRTPKGIRSYEILKVEYKPVED